MFHIHTYTHKLSSHFRSFLRKPHSAMLMRLNFPWKDASYCSMIVHQIIYAWQWSLVLPDQGRGGWYSLSAPGWLILTKCTRFCCHGQRGGGWCLFDLLATGWGAERAPASFSSAAVVEPSAALLGQGEGGQHLFSMPGKWPVIHSSAPPPACPPASMPRNQLSHLGRWA